MISQSMVNNRRLIPIAKAKPKLLIVSDTPEHLINLRAGLSGGEVEITSATSAEELRYACHAPHDVAVVDVAPGRLVNVLRALRDSEENKNASVLVETSRLMPEPGLAGILPAYRAMPCSNDQLIELTRRRFASLGARLSFKQRMNTRVL